MLSFIKMLVKRLIFAFFALYAISLILNLIDIHVPINIFSLTVGTILGFPGIISILLVFVFLL